MNLLNTKWNSGINRILRPTFAGFSGTPTLTYTPVSLDPSYSGQTMSGISLQSGVDATGPWVKLLYDTSQSPSWRAMSNGVGYTFRVDAVDGSGNRASMNISASIDTDSGLYGPGPSCTPI
jgi:hypothetical protein